MVMTKQVLKEIQDKLASGVKLIDLAYEYRVWPSSILAALRRCSSSEED
jgi:hypothetical protein